MLNNFPGIAIAAKKTGMIFAVDFQVNTGSKIFKNSQRINANKYVNIAMTWSKEEDNVMVLVDSVLYSKF